MLSALLHNFYSRLPNQSPEPTAVGAGPSAVAVHVTSRWWLSFLGHIENPMEYKTSCPNCRKRVSRWYIFFEPTFYHRCRGCGAKFRMNHVDTLIALIIATVCCVLERMHLISPMVVVGLLLATMIVWIWLLPYFSPTQLKREADIRNP
jgi:uncharacterized protein (DUF983 family)